MWVLYFGVHTVWQQRLRLSCQRLFGRRLGTAPAWAFSTSNVSHRVGFADKGGCSFFIALRLWTGRILDYDAEKVKRELGWYDISHVASYEPALAGQRTSGFFAGADSSWPESGHEMSLTLWLHFNSDRAAIYSGVLEDMQFSKYKLEGKKKRRKNSVY